MKKIIVVISAALILAMALSACGGKSSKAPAASGNYTTIYEQSEIRWYIAEKYGQEAVSKYCFYDLDDQGEESFVVAYRYLPGDEPEVLVRCFNKDMDDWFFYDNDILVSEGVEELDDVPGIGKIYGATLYCDLNPYNEYSVGPGPFYAYITYNKNGLMERFFLRYDMESDNGVAGRYEYDKTGAVCVYYGYEWDMLLSDFFSSEYDPSEGWEYQYKYSYGGDGFLKEAVVEVYRYDDEPYIEEQYSFLYGDEGRIKTEESEPEYSNTKTVAFFERDREGKLVSAIIQDGKSDYEVKFNFNYESDGFCVYIPASD